MGSIGASASVGSIGASASAASASPDGAAGAAGAAAVAAASDKDKCTNIKGNEPLLPFLLLGLDELCSDPNMTFARY